LLYPTEAFAYPQKINGNFEDTDQRCAEQIKGEVK